MTLGGRVIACTCPAGNKVYWEERRLAAEAEKAKREERDEDE